MTEGATDELLIERRTAENGQHWVEVTFNRPEKLNAFTREMYLGLHELCRSLAEDPSVKVLVLRGAGRAFAAGNDIEDFLARDQVPYEEEIRAMFTALFELPQVTIAAIDGACVGGGLAIATHCDLRIATPRSRFGYPIARTLGNALSSPVLFRCAAVFGESLTREMLLTARLQSAERAHGVGALLAVTESLADDVAELVASIMALSSVTLRTTKSQLGFRAAALEPVPSGEEELLRAVYAGPDFAEGVRAFLAKAKPDFR
ncbi:enoyl-CoA hydratase-related protein [Nocardioides sp. BP30]|uniref:enoyl-CoA hydratase-related protein n=1 Tax=Nocardioides sp. BP30 TaxID=3036374 RepID=UPI0024694241|nr:enoyl-CoA hydratase-related protein [Nocardioides sp. BP30]WGL53076.1 enoyl-CoA hydratase-related protein [Nocardioides sp. BP30]